MGTKLRFTKMHGCGNDYIYVDCLQDAPALSAGLIQKLSDRHFGIGGDGVVLILPSEKCDFRMRIFNADASEAEMCGNAVRCIAKYLFEKGLTDKRELRLETMGGLRILQLNAAGRTVESVRVDMGEPALSPAAIPVLLEREEVINQPLPIAGRVLRMTCVSVGNPHAVFFVDELSDELVLGLGPQIERHPLFPAKTNVEFVQVKNRSTVKMRVWERGSGETLACGTATAAIVVAAALNGLTERHITVQCRGGDLDLEWGADNHVYKTGPAAIVFEGEVDLDALQWG